MSNTKYPWSQKRKDLYSMGQLIQTFAQAIVADPHMPENPWPMTLGQLNDHVLRELSRMNAAKEW